VILAMLDQTSHIRSHLPQFHQFVLQLIPTC
jgi:hypothetical protein